MKSGNVNYSLNSHATLENGGVYRIGNLVIIQLRFITNTTLDNTTKVVYGLPIPRGALNNDRQIVISSNKADMVFTVDGTGELKPVSSMATSTYILTGCYVAA